VSDELDSPRGLALSAFVALVVSVALVALCAVVSATCLSFGERAHGSGRYQNPYRKSAHRCSVMTWCCGFFFAGVALLVGGLIGIVSVPLEGSCHLLRYPTLDTLQTVLAALGADANLTAGASSEGAELTSAALGTARQFVGQCLSTSGAIGGSASLLSVLRLAEGNESISLQSKSDQDRFLMELSLSVLASTLDEVQAKYLKSPDLVRVLVIMNARGSSIELAEGAYHCGPSRTCSANQFAQLLQELGARLRDEQQRAVMGYTRLRNASLPALRRLLDELVLLPLDTASSPELCSFVSTHYEQVVFEICNDGITGFRLLGRSLVACGLLAFAAAALAHCIWRRALDNVTMWRAFESPSTSRPQPPACTEAGPVLLGSKLRMAAVVTCDDAKGATLS